MFLWEDISLLPGDEISKHSHIESANNLTVNQSRQVGKQFNSSLTVDDAL